MGSFARKVREGFALLRFLRPSVFLLVGLGIFLSLLAQLVCRNRLAPGSAAESCGLTQDDTYSYIKE